MNNHPRLLTSTILVVLSLFIACSPLPRFNPKAACLPGSVNHQAKVISEILHRHAITFERDGKALDTQTGQPLNRAQLAERARFITDALENHKPKRVLLYVHGGLNSRSAHVKRALSGAIQMDPVEFALASNQGLVSPDFPHEPAGSADSYFPIFVNWNSGAYSTYVDHLTSVRSGISYSRSSPFTKYFLALGAPYGLVRDVGIGVLNAPGQFYKEILKDHETDGGIFYQSAQNLFPTRQTFEQRLVELGWNKNRLEGIVKNYGDPVPKIGSAGAVNETVPFNFSLASDPTGTGKAFVDSTLYYTLLPLKAPGMPLVSGIGTPAWNNMQRRTSTTLYPDSFFITGSRAADKSEVSDSEYFFGRIFGKIRQMKAKRSMELTCVGHSMGAIVLNGVINKHPEIKIDDLVYMAPAASLEDSGLALRDPNQLSKLRSNIERFYLLTLHPRREIEEGNFLVAPNGSLLNWIDEFYQNPLSFGGRTLGTCQNAMIAANVWLPKGRNVSVKSFGVAIGQENAEDPQKHGEFGDRPYWKRSFWKHDNGDGSWRNFFAAKQRNSKNSINSLKL